MAQGERLDFSVHIEEADTLQVAKLGTSFLDPKDWYSYTPGFMNWHDTGITVFTDVARERSTRVGNTGYSSGSMEHIFSVNNKEHTDDYRIRFGRLEPEMANKIREEFQAAFPTR